MNWYIRVLTADDKEGLKELLLLYCEEEATAKCLKLTPQEKEVLFKWYIEEILPQGLTLGVFEATSDELCACGFITDGIEHLKPESFDPNEETSNLAKLTAFDWEMIKDVPNIAKNQLHRHLHIFFVHPKYRRMGLATKIEERCEEMALADGCTMLTTVANVVASREASLKRDFKIHKEVFYKDYKDPTSGERIFKNMPPPHSGAVLCYKQLSEKQNL